MSGRRKGVSAELPITERELISPENAVSATGGIAQY
jgi:hypothetical protein